MSKLTELYGNLIDLCGVEISTYGRLAVPTVGADGAKEEIILKYDGMPIIFPEKQYINDPENKDAKAIVLHPLSESSLRAPSEVQDVLRKAGIVRLCYVGEFLLRRAVELNHNASMDDGFKLNHTLSALFSEVGTVDVKFVNWFEKLMKEMTTNSGKRLFNIYLKQHGEIGKNKYDRLCVISSPLYDEIMVGSDGNKLFDVEAPRKKDIQTLRLIVESLFPDLANNGYIVGSSASVAPTLMAFMEGMSLIAKRLNTLLTKYGKEAKGIEGGTTKGTDWNREENFSTLRLAHTIEEYNIGVGKDGDKGKRSSTEEVAPTRSNVESTLSVPKREKPTDERREDRRESRETREDAKPTELAFWERDDREDRRDRRDRYDDRYDDRDRDRRDDRRRDDRYDDRRRDDRYDDRRDDRRRDDHRDDRRERSRDRDRYDRDDRRSSSNDHPFWDR